MGLSMTPRALLGSGLGLLVAMSSSFGGTTAAPRPSGLCPVATASIGQSEFLSEEGHVPAAIQGLAASLEVAVQSHDQAGIAAAEGALGNAYALGHAYDLALPYLEKSVSDATAGGVGRIAAISLVDLGNVYLALGRLDEAESRYREAEIVARRLHDSGLVGLVETNEARLLLRQLHEEPALAKLADVLAGARQGTPQASSVRTLVTAGRLAERVTETGGDTRFRAVAQESLALAVVQADAAADSRSKALAQGYLGALYESAGDHRNAETLTSEALFAAQATGALDLLYRWDWQLGTILAAEGDLDGAIVALRRAVAAVENIRADIPVEYREGQSSYLATIGGLYRQLADLLLQRAHAERKELTSGPLLIEARSTLETMKIGELKDYFRDECLAKAESRTRDIDAVASRTAVLYPVILKDRLELLVYLADGPHEIVVPVASADLIKTVKSFRALLEKRTTRQYIIPGRQLYAWLIEPLLPVLRAEKVDTIVWIPDGALRTVPLGALPEGGKFVIDEFAVATAPGLSLVDPKPIGAQKAGATLLAGMSLASQGFPALPSVRREIGAITKVRQGTVLLDADFKVDSMDRAMSSAPYDVVHIASHGVFDHDPAKSFLLAYDGKLTLGRLEQAVKQSGQADASLELLVLSACQTAVGDDRAALGLAGVAIKAGARSAMASLWFISDKAAAQLVVNFYRQLQVPGTSKAQALQRAQIALKADPRFRHPAYWSPFLLIGNWL